MTEPSYAGTVLVYSIHNAEQWWRRIGEGIGFERFVIMSTHHNDGDVNIRKDFYATYRRLRRSHAQIDAALETTELQDIIARCRLLRSLPPRRAARMALAMAHVIDRVLDSVQPSVIISWPIDYYISDTLARHACTRRIPYVEITASPLLDRTMMLHRGCMIEWQGEVDADRIEAATKELADPLFALPHMRRRPRFTWARYWKTYLYFKLRGLGFWLLSHFWSDPLNAHYLDAQSFLAHKPRLGDYRTLLRQDPDWLAKIKVFPRDRRLFLALQLFPEASIDYWVRDPSLVINHEDMLVEMAQAFSDAGYVIAAKDHPLQFGFRQVDLIDRLLRISNVVFIPYEISGNDVVAVTGATFTTTGTLGVQTAMLGSKTIVTDPYFATPHDFVMLSSRDQIAGLPQRLDMFPTGGSMAERQRRIAEKLLRGSFDGDYMTYHPFYAHSDPASVHVLAARLGEAVQQVIDGRRRIASVPIN